MNNTLKGLLVGLVLLYVVSPLDIAPGPIDDLLVTLLGYVGTRAIESRRNSHF